MVVFALLLSLLAALAAAFLLLETAWSQEGPEHGYVDLVMLYEYGTGIGADQDKVRYIVRNTGTATATGVTRFISA